MGTVQEPLEWFWSFDLTKGHSGELSALLEPVDASSAYTQIRQNSRERSAEEPRPLTGQ